MSIQPLYLNLEPNTGVAKGALYVPDSGPAPHVGILVMHRVDNYLPHPACIQLSQRRRDAGGMNTRYDNNEELRCCSSRSRST